MPPQSLCLIYVLVLVPVKQFQGLKSHSLILSELVLICWFPSNIKQNIAQARGVIWKLPIRRHFFEIHITLDPVSCTQQWSVARAKTIVCHFQLKHTRLLYVWQVMLFACLNITLYRNERNIIGFIHIHLAFHNARNIYAKILLLVIWFNVWAFFSSFVCHGAILNRAMDD